MIKDYPWIKIVCLTIIREFPYFIWFNFIFILWKT